MADPPGRRLPFAGLEAIKVRILGFRSFVLVTKYSEGETEQEELC